MYINTTVTTSYFVSSIGTMGTIDNTPVGKSKEDSWHFWRNMAKRHRINDVMHLRRGRGVGGWQPYCNIIDLFGELFER